MATGRSKLKSQIFVLATLVFIIFMGAFPYNSFAACAICGCNPAPSPEAGQGITIIPSPANKERTIVQCCLPWPGDANGDGTTDGAEYAAACGFSVLHSDKDKLTSHRWIHEGPEPCNCKTTTSISFPDDLTTVTWSGSVNRCAPGSYTITATVKNVAVQQAELGGEICGELCYDGWCCGTKYCTQKVNVSVMETKIETFTVNIESVCDAAKRQGRNLVNGVPSMGGVICYGGQKYACVWEPQDDGTSNTEGQQQCLREHEEDHFDDMECPTPATCELTRPEFKIPTECFQAQQEYNAYQAQLSCLQGQLSGCSSISDPAARQSCIDFYSGWVNSCQGTVDDWRDKAAEKCNNP